MRVKAVKAVEGNENFVCMVALRKGIISGL
jgi:hypothetical protein